MGVAILSFDGSSSFQCFGNTEAVSGPVVQTGTVGPYPKRAEVGPTASGFWFYKTKQPKNKHTRGDNKPHTAQPTKTTPTHKKRGTTPTDKNRSSMTTQHRTESMTNTTPNSLLGKHREQQKHKNKK